MSGPKVVEIVTREEIIAICEALISAAEKALQRWIKIGNRSDLLSDEDVALGNERIATLRRMLDNDQFDAIQKQAPREVSYLRSDIERRIESAAEKAVRKQAEARRRVSAAATLAVALGAKGLPVPAALARPRSVAEADLQSAIALAFASLSSVAHGPELSQKQQELASRLKEEETGQTLAQWLNSQAQPRPSDKAFENLERRYLELVAFAPERATIFEARMAKVSDDRSDRRSLLIDSLAADIAAARSTAEAEAEITQELDALETQLRQFASPIASQQLAAIDHLRADASQTGANTNEIEASKKVIETLTAERSEAARRKAVLDGLSQLGYEVKEGMQTAWVRDGRVVLKSNRSPGYGVELGGDPKKMMQVRTVAFTGVAAASNPSADVAAETEFCGDFSKLQEKIAADGGNLVLIKALGIGATPVKRIEVVSDTDSATTDTSPSVALSRKL